MVLLFVILVLIKLTCTRKLGLLISLVIMASNFETIALISLIIQTFLQDYPEENDMVQLSFRFSPMILLAAGLIANACISAKYFRAIRKPIDLEDKATCPSTKLCFCLLVSTLLSFHNVSWLNIRGQLPLQLKRRLFMHGFTEEYARASKVATFVPKLLVLSYGVYFGVFESAGRIDLDWSIKQAVLDLTLVSSFQLFLLHLALNFQWSSKALAQKEALSSTSVSDDKGK